MQQITQIIAVRHGETDWNVATRVQGQLDIPLNDNGRWQAGRLALALASEQISKVYSSDLQRALETAQPVANGSGLDIVTDIGLRERHFGEFEGFTFKEIEQRWPDKNKRWRQRDPDFSPREGESLRQFYARCVEAATRIADTHLGQTIMLVAHGGVMDCLYRAAMHIDIQTLRTWQVGNTNVNRLIYSPQGFAMVGWSDTRHLDGAALPHDGNVCHPGEA
jgi:probable phosphoglycerate mutase